MLSYTDPAFEYYVHFRFEKKLFLCSMIRHYNFLWNQTLH